MSKPTGKLAFAYETIAKLDARIDALLAERDALKKALQGMIAIHDEPSGFAGKYGRKDRKMSKVLVDRELLAGLVSNDRETRLDAERRMYGVLANQPAEAEGVERYDWTYDEMAESQDGNYVRHGDYSTLLAENARLENGVRSLRAIHSMILSALDRDAESGKAARGEMADELRAALQELDNK